MYKDKIRETNYGDLPVPEFSTSTNYPVNWKDISTAIKTKAGYKCVRCGAKNKKEGHTILTVHHLIPAGRKPWLTVWWNLPALCQRCHLHMEGKVVMERFWMFEHTDWFKPYAAGYYAWRQGLPYDRESVEINLEFFLSLGKPIEVEIRFPKAR